MLKELKRDHHITYLALDDGSVDERAREQATEYCHELACLPHYQREKFTAGFYAELFLNLASSLPYAIKKYESPEMRREVAERAENGSVDVVVCDFLAPAANVPQGLPCASVLFQHNVEAMIWKRHVEVQTNPIRKRYLRMQWQKMAKFEAEMCRVFDSVVAVSVEDREHLKTEYGARQVYDVPTGVDTEFFTPTSNEKVIEHNLVFTGSMDWLPNEDGIRYFTEEILPLVRKSVPDASLTVVGRNPYPSLLELSKRDSKVVVTGRVDDVRPYMERAAVYIVPLRVGGGTRLKIYEAMAMEKPIVSTTIGAEGLPITDGIELRIADTPEAFATAVTELFRDPQSANTMGSRAAAVVREKFGWSGVANRFAEICDKAIREYDDPVVSAAVAEGHEQPAV